jgi:hypothetical protein
MSQEGDAPPPEQNGKQNEQNGDKDGDVVTPWTVTSSSATGIDYDKLISKLFLCQIPT